jgi:hypothetical protein
MSRILLPLLLTAAAASAGAAAGPTPAPSPTPTPTATPTASPTPGGAPKPRSLADIARERKLVPLRGGAAEPASPEAQGPLRVEELQDNGAVSDGYLSVFGRVRNTGRGPACHVRLFLRMFDEHGVLLSKGETTDLKTVPAGDAVPFGARLKVPPGVRGSHERPPDVLAEGPARTNWSLVARVEGEVLDFSEDCP